LHGDRLYNPAVLVVRPSLDSHSGVWIFARGAERIQVSRVPLPGGSWTLLVDGPGPAHRAEQCGDLVVCVCRQQEIERALLGEGFRLDQLVTGSSAQTSGG
jgi:hypothetical protein